MEGISILSWNFRGLASSVNRNNVKRFIQQFIPSVICLQESMYTIQYDLLKYSMGVYDISCFAEVLSSG